VTLVVRFSINTDRGGGTMAGAMSSVATPPSDHVRVELLHQFRIRVDGLDVAVSDGAARMAAFLALDDRPRLRLRLAATLWPERQYQDGVAAVRRALWRLNRDVPGLIHTSGQMLSLAEHVQVDVRDIDRLADDVGAGRDWSQPNPAQMRLLESDLLPEWSFDWIEAARESLRQRRLHTLEALAEAQLDGGRPGIALDLALRAVAVDPLRESAHRLVICAHLAEENAAEALRHFAHYEELLWREMRLRPGPKIQSLIDGLRTPVARVQRLARRGRPSSPGR
jgi:DNA-binding SARP family transcriptional activator